MTVAFFNFNDIPDYANAAALTAVDTTSLSNGSYANITDLGLFQLDKNSTATPDSTTIIAGDKAGVNWIINYYSRLILNANAEIDGSQIASFSSVSLANGTVGAPALTWANDQTDGWYRIGSHNEGYAINGSQVFNVSATAFTAAVPVVAPVASAAAPAYTFTGDVDTGLYHPGANQLGIAVNGAAAVTVSTSAVTLASGLGLTLTSGSIAVTSGNVTLTSGNLTMSSGRLLEKQGANVASAGDVTLGADGNFFLITGTTTINTIVATNWQAGAVIRLMFNGSLTVKHNTAGAGASFLLAGAADFSATANDTLSLVYNGTNWVEIGRAVI